MLPIKKEGCKKLIFKLETKSSRVWISLLTTLLWTSISMHGVMENFYWTWNTMYFWYAEITRLCSMMWFKWSDHCEFCVLMPFDIHHLHKHWYLAKLLQASIGTAGNDPSNCFPHVHNSTLEKNDPVKVPLSVNFACSSRTKSTSHPLFRNLHVLLKWAGWAEPEQFN